MDLILKVLGLIFLLILIFVVVVVLTIRAKLRKFVKTMEGMVEGVAASTTTPARIHLVPMAANDWDDAEAIKAQVDPLLRLGFQTVGDFEVEPMTGLRLQALVRPDEQVTAVVYEHPKVGIWLDLFTHFEDGTRMTYANTRQGSGVDHAPGHTVERFPGMDPAEMYRKFLADRPGRPAKRYEAGDFVAAFEKAYADEMDWRNSRGGPTTQEIRNIAALTGDDDDEDLIEATRELMERQALQQLGESIRERFLKESKMPAHEWEEVRERIVIIHDKLTPELMEEVAELWCGDGETDHPFEPSPGGLPRDEFSLYNASLPADRRFRKLAELNEPIAADVYCAPEE